MKYVKALKEKIKIISDKNNFNLKRDYIKLNRKILIIFTIITFLMLGIVYLLTYNLFLNKFQKLEKREINKEAVQAVSALEQDLSQLEKINQDYAAWNNTYKFMKDKNSGYITDNFMNETFSINSWDCLIIVDKQGKIIYKNKFNLNNKQRNIASKDILEDLKIATFLKSAKPTDKITGIISINQEYMMVSANPIVTSHFKGPIRGTFITGRYIDQNKINQLSKQADLSIRIKKFNKNQLPKEVDRINFDLIGKTDIWSNDTNDNYIYGYSTVYDIEQRPIFSLEVSKTKDIYQQGYLNMIYFMILILLIGVIYLITTWSFMEKFIFIPLELLIKSINKISQSKDLSTRIPIESKDEFSAIKNEFNTMLEILERSQQKIIYQSRHDELTKLPNRSYFYKQVEESLDNLKQGDDGVFFFIDIDEFKSINDSFGHDIGDLLLKSITKRLKEILPLDSIISRMGGDEFIVFIQNVKGKKAVEEIAKMVILKAKEPYLINDKQLTITLSIGISLYPTDSISIDDLINKADIAMYNVKKANRNNFKFYTVAMSNKLSKDMLSNALENGELEVYYQPKVNGVTGKVEGIEALLRWNHPEQGIISPAEFIPLAEDTGLIIPIGEWVLKTACQQNKEWNQMVDYPLTVGVNISNIQFAQSNFIQMVKRILKETNLSPKYLELEITESVAMDNEEEVINKLFMLKQMGISIAIDDFGTGYSSLSYLQKLPIDTLKIDKVFIDNILINDTIAKMIIDMARNLEISVIAEGVESEEQLKQLLNLGCMLIQGYLFSKPLSAIEFKELLIKNVYLQLTNKNYLLNEGSSSLLF